MYRPILLIALSSSLAACASAGPAPTSEQNPTPVATESPAPVTTETVAVSAAELDFGDYTSSTLTTKAWGALDEKNHAAALAYTRECVRRYADEGRRMNASMTAFAPSSRAFEKWALNDVGTSLFIMGKAYAEMEMYAEAAAAYEQLIKDFSYAQCWDPKGWFWRPAEVAAELAKEYRSRAQ